MKNLRWVDKYSIAVVVLLFVASYIRLYYGVDYTDEAFYIALPYRFILGDRPIIDEYSICQFAAILVYPFYKIFFTLHHSTQGIVLFARHLYLLFCGLLSVLTYSTFKKILGNASSLLLACIPLLYVPYNISGLSYNTLAILCFTGASLFLLRNISTKTIMELPLISAALLYALATFSYPPFLVAVFFATLMSMLIIGFKRITLNFFVGALPVIIVLAVFLTKYQHEIVNVYYNLKEIGYGNKTASQFTVLFNTWIESILYLKISLVLIFGIVLLKIQSYRQKRQSLTSQLLSRDLIAGSRHDWVFYFGYISLLLLPLLLLIGYTAEYINYGNSKIWHSLFINFSLLAPLYSGFTSQKQFSRKVIALLWAPSIAAGIMTAYASSNGFQNSMVGLLPAFIATVLLIYLATQHLLSINIFMEFDTTHLASIIPVLLLSTTLLSMLYFKFAFFYRENSLGNLNFRITKGPYKYLLTTKSKEALLTLLDLDLKNITAKNHPTNIAVYPSNAGLYLVSSLKPKTSTLWLTPIADNRLAIEYFQRNQYPDVVILANGLIKYPDDSLLQVINSSAYTKMQDRGSYTIYLRESRF